jgi:hypothetical protein
LQVDALLTRAHDLEAQGKSHEAYRFALVAHQIVQQEKLTLPPGQERPIDYLDALSAAADTVEHDSSWNHQERESQPAESRASVASLTQNQERAPDEWVESTESDSPFRTESDFAEWRTLSVEQPARAAVESALPVREATFEGNAVPTIRPSTFGQHRNSNANAGQAPSVRSSDEYGPRFSDPITSHHEAVPSDEAVQPVSLSVELTNPINTAALSQTQRDSLHLVEPPAWRNANESVREPRVAVAPEVGLAAPQLGATQQTAYAPAFPSFTGPSFGTQPAVDVSTPAETAVVEEALDPQVLADTSDSQSNVAGKPLTFWAMIGGLILLLACALLRRPTESRESFH